MAKHRKHHYVPIWYQERFLSPGERKYFRRNLNPERIINGRTIVDPEISNDGPKQYFYEPHLYAVSIPGHPRYIFEKKFFGGFDNIGPAALNGVARSTEDQAIDEHAFRNFFGCMAMQALRTPKGLASIASRLPGGASNTELMRALSRAHGTGIAMWSEGIQELLQVEDPNFEFIVSDHPVTLYNRAFPPRRTELGFSADPRNSWIGTQTIFPIDKRHCVVFTHSQLIDNGLEEGGLLTDRINPRLIGNAIIPRHHVRHRSISLDDAGLVNQIIFAQASKYVAASLESTLFPDQHSISDRWPELGKCLLPSRDPVKQPDYVFLGLPGDRVIGQDKYGRRIEPDIASEFHTTQKQKMMDALKAFMATEKGAEVREQYQRAKRKDEG